MATCEQVRVDEWALLSHLELFVYYSSWDLLANSKGIKEQLYAQMVGLDD